MNKDFRKFAISSGVNGLVFDDYRKKTFNGLISPTIIEERNLNVATLDVFSRLMYDHIIFLGTEIDSDVANIINAQLLYLNSVIDKDEDVKLFINSPGGSVIDGLSIYDTMNFIDPDVSTYCMGLCASMGSVILSSGKKGKRYSLPHGSIMLHQVSNGIGHAQCADIQIMANETKKIQNVLYNILADNTGKTFEEIEKDADRDNWMTPEEAIMFGSKGLIDSIVKK